MVFSSVVFLFLFLPVTLVLYFFLKDRIIARNVLLLIASLCFYFWGEGRYVLVMLMYIVCNYGFARIIEFCKGTRDLCTGDRKALRVLAVAVAFNLTFLFYYKYSNFALASMRPLLERLGLPLGDRNVHLPIGISFFTFQAISYVVDVYRGDVRASRSLLNFATYKSFFPQLIAGPIVRYKDVAKQVMHRVMSRKLFVSGIERFIVGLAKKVIIANICAVAADEIFKIPASSLTAPVAWLGIVCYSLQIYFDFSGYSDMAIGMAQMFGFKFLENFNYPYVALSLQDFWRRWHISLSTWFRDYLYIPLGGNRCANWRISFNLLLVFALCGLWHGAGWTFVIWGLWHGLFLMLERTRFGRLLSKAWGPLRFLYTMLVVAISWVCFRSESIEYATHYLRAAFWACPGDLVAYPITAYLNKELVLTIVLGVIFSAPIAPAFRHATLSTFRRLRKGGHDAHALKFAIDAGKSLLCLAILIVCLIQLASGTHNPFIYFRF